VKTSLEDQLSVAEQQIRDDTQKISELEYQLAEVTRLEKEYRSTLDMANDCSYFNLNLIN
jgi:hypothetical protein